MGLEADVAETLREVRQLRTQVERNNAELEALRRSLPPLLLSRRDAAAVLGISPTTLARRIKDKSIPINRATGRVDLGAMHPPPDVEVLRKVVELRKRAAEREGAPHGSP